MKKSITVMRFYLKCLIVNIVVTVAWCQSLCNLDYYNRVGSTPVGCSSGSEQIGSACYLPCNSTYESNTTNTICSPVTKACPSYPQGLTVIGNTTCWFYDYIDVHQYGDRASCESASGGAGTCRLAGASWVPKCQTGFVSHRGSKCFAQTDIICDLLGLDYDNNQTTGYCHVKSSYARPQHSLGPCGAGNLQLISGMCYGACSPGYIDYSRSSARCYNAPPLGWVTCSSVSGIAASASSSCNSFSQSQTYPNCSALNLPKAPIGIYKYSNLSLLDSLVTVNNVTGRVWLQDPSSSSSSSKSAVVSVSSLKVLAAGTTTGAFYEAILQSDGNLVVYRNDGAGRNPIYASHTNMNTDVVASYYLLIDSIGGILYILQTDVIGPIWTSMANPVNLGADTYSNTQVGLSMQENGNLVLYVFYPDGTCDPIWNIGIPNPRSPEGYVVWPH